MVEVHNDEFEMMVDDLETLYFVVLGVLDFAGGFGVVGGLLHKFVTILGIYNENLFPALNNNLIHQNY